MLNIDRETDEKKIKKVETTATINNDKDFFLRRAIQVAKRSAQQGNLPYGCVLVDEQGNVLLEGENSVITDNDVLAHAEVNLLHIASKRYAPEFLKNCTIYTSDEPCPMCASAIFWSGVGQLVFGLSQARFFAEFGRKNSHITFDLSCRELLKFSGRQVKIAGPLLEHEVLCLHRRT
ncbi:tRNA-specific adenosine deaminase [Thalassotalea insulae]|uniref:tRNA-specific adenosine deaminase n=1 Tax=Thalassotalea insulae TaxID=2056778 RepID=A0ABQ6GLT5_9GAMM|nr:nucleoside deaminase [Thalassotalea insulae]GLX76968.1 tRNA-specific adenosine deaminase [Thalassotalea insulae]